MADLAPVEYTSINVKTLFLRTIWIFQAIISGVIFVALGLYSLAVITRDLYPDIYDFVRAFFTAILAGAVVLVVLIQRKIMNTPKAFTRNCEIGKSAIATTVWFWWFIDSIVGPHPGYMWQKVSIIIGIASLLLFILFYPAVWHATCNLEDEEQGGQIRLDDEQRLVETP